MLTFISVENRWICLIQQYKQFLYEYVKFFFLTFSWIGNRDEDLEGNILKNGVLNCHIDWFKSSLLYIIVIYLFFSFRIVSFVRTIIDFTVSTVDRFSYIL